METVYLIFLCSSWCSQQFSFIGQTLSFCKRRMGLRPWCVEALQLMHLTRQHQCTMLPWTRFGWESYAKPRISYFWYIRTDAAKASLSRVLWLKGHVPRYSFISRPKIGDKLTMKGRVARWQPLDTVSVHFFPFSAVIPLNLETTSSWTAYQSRTSGLQPSSKVSIFRATWAAVDFFLL